MVVPSVVVAVPHTTSSTASVVSTLSTHAGLFGSQPTADAVSANVVSPFVMSPGTDFASSWTTVVSLARIAGSRVAVDRQHEDLARAGRDGRGHRGDREHEHAAS